MQRSVTMPGIGEGNNTVSAPSGYSYHQAYYCAASNCHSEPSSVIEHGLVLRVWSCFGPVYIVLRDAHMCSQAQI